jgi:hypothetical protein
MYGMKSIKATTKAWLPSHASPEDLLGDSVHAISTMAYSDSDMQRAGWTLVGEAEITVILVDEDQIILNKVDSLRAEKNRIIADAQVKVNDIEGKIQSLLAIEFKE